VLVDAGQPARARGHAVEALELGPRIGYRLREGVALTVLAAIDLAQGVESQAIETAERALAIQRETGHRADEARAQVILGHAYNRSGPAGQGRTCWQAARALFEEIGMRQAAEVGELLAMAVG